eukprot:TRINITY_DN10972_c0_g1_i7.p1 TRINITY_DN10972_c0_g1~~TRINITY_DN10972_c0_g1_i7.p1  ORF type:complete len:410 (+),score=113.36 TRINITY_DN10972_c0_g1_i7:66-1295(+)
MCIRDSLITELIGLKEKRIKELVDSEEVQTTIKEAQSNVKIQVDIEYIQTDVEKLLKQIKSDFDNRRYIDLFERNVSRELGQIRKRIKEWKELVVESKKDFVEDIKVNMTSIEKKLNSLVTISYVSRPSPQFIYNFDNVTNKLLLYDMRNRTTQIVCFGAHFHIPFHYSSAILDNKIYFTGGDDDGYRNDCYALSITKKYIQKLMDLNVERRNHGLIALHIVRVLYCVGGYNKRDGALKSVERYSFASARWVPIAPLNERRQWAGVCQFNNKHIYCFGGSNLSSIERLDILNEEEGWELMGTGDTVSPWAGRSACAAIQVDPYRILVFGGCARHDLDDASMYYPTTGKIKKCAKLPSPSLFCQLSPAISNQYVGIIGWRNEIVYLYNIQRDRWDCIEQAVYSLPDFDSK